MHPLRDAGTTTQGLRASCRNVVRPMAKDVWVGCRDATGGGILRRPR